MKIRNDFVSNSSSCSFIIEDIAAGLQALKELDILDAYEFNDIEIRFIVNNKTFHANKMDKYESWRDEQYDEVHCSCAAIELVQLPAAIKQNMKNLEFLCDDYNQNASLIVALLYKVLKLMDVSVNNENSEMNFPTEDSDSIIAKLFKYIMNSKIKSKEEHWKRCTKSNI